jgi:hypothetical protein
MSTPAGSTPRVRPVLRRSRLRRILRLAALTTLLASCTGELLQGESESERLVSSAIGGTPPCAPASPLEYAVAYAPAPAHAPGWSAWFNVKTDCPGGAVSLTSCIQQRLAAMNYAAPKQHLNPVIYFPDSTVPYEIEAALNIKGIHGVTFVGQSPGGTVLRWTGPVASSTCDTDCSMFWLNGSDHVTIKRMTLDGAGRASSLVRVAYVPETGANYQATAGGFEDLRLSNAAYGIRAGAASNVGDDHNTVRRVSFDHMTEAGFSAQGQNALNTNIWDSSFTFCNIGVRSEFGNFNVYNSTFQASTVADVVTFDNEDFTLQGNVSIRSPRFLIANGGGHWLIQNNKINVSSETAIYLPHPGSAVVIDNVIQTEAHLGEDAGGADAGATETGMFPVVVVNSKGTTANGASVTEHVNMILTGNQFNQPMKRALCVMRDGVDYDKPGGARGCEPAQEQALTARIEPGGGYFYGNTFGANVSFGVPGVPPAPTLKKAYRRVAAPNCVGADNTLSCDDTAKIQAAIDEAVASGGAHAVVHLQAGVYEVSRTLVVPGGSTVEIIGDSESLNGTVLRWFGPSDDYMFNLGHPARGAIHDLRIENRAFGSGTANVDNLRGRGIHVDAMNDFGGVVYFDRFLTGRVGTEISRPQPTQPTDNVGFSFADVDHLDIRSEASGTTEGDVSVRVKGTGAGQGNMASVKSVKLFGPVVTGTHRTQYAVTSYGNLYVNGFASESNTHAIQFNSEGAPNPSGRVTLVNGKEGASTGNLPLGITDPVQIVIGDFQGDVNLIGINTTAPISVRAGSPANVMAFGNLYTNSWQWFIPGTNDSAPFGWNENGPATPFTGALDAGTPTYGWPTVSSKPWSTSFIDCNGYVADDHLDTSQVPAAYAGFPGVLPVTQSPSSKQGFFKVAGPSNTARLVNNTMGDSTYKAPHACRDVTPPTVPAGAAPVVTPAIEHALIEVRSAAAGRPERPCSANVTDARFFHVAVGSAFTRNAFAIDPYPGSTDPTW